MSISYQIYNELFSYATKIVIIFCRRRQNLITLNSYISLEPTSKARRSTKSKSICDFEGRKRLKKSVLLVF
jgi:hypothetical protein